MSRDPKLLSPHLRELHAQFMKLCNDDNDPSTAVITVCTYRSNKDQQAAFDAGASNARPGQSKHNALDKNGNPASKAFDIGVIRFGKYISNGKDPAYLRAGQIGESLGLKWAGRWTGKIRETCHYEIGE